MSRNPFLSAELDELPKCPGCSKDVYPSERPLQCLGATWHPGCIKCTVCGITLTPRMMETYEKKPYCKAHRPTTKATTVSDDFHTKAQAQKPKPASRQAGVDLANTGGEFKSGPGQHIDALQKQAYESRQQLNPTSFVSVKAPTPTNHGRVQGINKTEGTTFHSASITKSSADTFAQQPRDESSQASSASASSSAPAVRPTPGRLPSVQRPATEAPVVPSTSTSTSAPSSGSAPPPAKAPPPPPPAGGRRNLQSDSSGDMGSDLPPPPPSVDEGPAGSYDQGQEGGGYEEGGYGGEGQGYYEGSGEGEYQNQGYGEGEYQGEGYDQGYGEGGYEQGAGEYSGEQQQ